MVTLIRGYPSYKGVKPHISVLVKPIFHCNAKPLTLGLLVGRCQTQSLCRPNAKPGGPNASQWNIVSVVYARVGFALFIPFFSRWVPNANTFSGGIWALRGELAHPLIQRSPVQFRARSQTGVTDYDEACKMHLTPGVVHNFLKAVVFRISVPYAQKYPRFLFEKKKGATPGVLVSRLNNRW